MGLSDMFAKTMVCPECRYQGAKKVLFSIKCPNPQCKQYDSQLVSTGGAAPATVVSGSRLSGNYNPGPKVISIVYRNFRGENQTYQGDRSTLRSGKSYVSLQVVPTGKRISLNKKFISNLNEVESAVDRATPETLVKQSPAQPVTVKYRNYDGQERIFKTDSSLLQSEGNRVILRLISEGKKFYLKKAQIVNLAEIEGKFLKR